MALLTTATADNRAIDTALSKTYARRVVYGTWTKVELNVTTTYTKAWEYSRVATKSYRYVGLTEAAAKQIAADYADYYTRATKVSEWDSEDGEFKHVDGGSVPMATVVPQHEDGGMWSVVIFVDEQDTRLDLSPSRSFATLFATEDARSYDGE